MMHSALCTAVPALTQPQRLLAAAYARRLSDWMTHHHYRIPKMHDAAVRRVQNTTARQYPDGSRQVIFSWQQIDEMLNGRYVFDEYATVRRYIGEFWRDQPQGLRAVHFMVLHEVAHIRHYADPTSIYYRPRRRGQRLDVHGREFCRLYKENIVTFPFMESVMTLFEEEALAPFLTAVSP